MHQTSALEPSRLAVTPRRMRDTLAGFATGIAVVAAEVDGNIAGLAVNSFTSVSLDPPLVSACFARTSTTWAVLRRAPRWGISVLGEDHAEVIPALRRPSAERFACIDMSVADDGSALVDGSLATLTVDLHAEVDAGDHVLALLRVRTLHRDVEQRPLVYFGSEAHRLDPHAQGHVGSAPVVTTQVEDGAW